MDCVSRDLGLRIFFVFLITFLSNPLCSLCSACIFFILYSVDFLRYLQREFVEQSRVSLFSDNFLSSCDPNV